ncbi:MAG: hypothetical protein MPN21_03695 [Thermoanaerobaculia bacterium]|nr:hypothetical protein [Thermoanaerobaculia bacterium]
MNVRCLSFTEPFRWDSSLPQLQQRSNRCIECWSAEIPRDDPAFGIDHEQGRHGLHVEAPSRNTLDAGGLVDLRPVDAVATEEREQPSSIDRIERHAENQQILVFMLLAKGSEMGQLGQARCAPGGPEIEHDDPAEQGIGSPGPTVEIDPIDGLPDTGVRRLFLCM